MKYIIITIVMLLVSGCSFKSPHERFIKDMNYFLIDYNNYEKEKLRWYHIYDEYVTHEDYDKKGNRLYHFKMPTNYCEEGYCKYYIVVNPKGIIINWGFDNCDYEKCCQIKG